MFFPRNPTLPLVQSCTAYTVKSFQKPFEELSHHGLVACLTPDSVYLPIVELSEYIQLGYISADTLHRIVKSLAPFLSSIFKVPCTLVLSPCSATFSVLDLRTCLTLLQECRGDLASAQAPFHVRVQLDIEGCPPPQAFKQDLSMYQCKKHPESPHTCPNCYGTSFDKTRQDKSCTFCWTQFTPPPPPLIPALLPRQQQSSPESSNFAQPASSASYAAVANQWPLPSKSGIRSKHPKQQQQPKQQHQQQQSQDPNSQVSALRDLVEDHFQHLCNRVTKLESEAATFNMQTSRKNANANLLSKIKKLERELLSMQTKLDQAALPQPIPPTNPPLPLPPCTQAAPHTTPHEDVVNVENQDPFGQTS